MIFFVSSDLVTLQRINTSYLPVGQGTDRLCQLIQHPSGSPYAAQMPNDYPARMSGFLTPDDLAIVQAMTQYSNTLPSDWYVPDGVKEGQTTLNYIN